MSNILDFDRTYPDAKKVVLLDNAVAVVADHIDVRREHAHRAVRHDGAAGSRAQLEHVRREVCGRIRDDADAATAEATSAALARGLGSQSGDAGNPSSPCTTG